MKIGVVRAVIAAGFLATLGGAAQAQDVTISFKGTIVNTGGLPYPEVTAGIPFTGVFTYNLATPDSSPHPQVGSTGITRRRTA